MKIDLSDVPIVAAAIVIKTETSEATMVCSIAVATLSFATKSLRNEIVEFLHRFLDGGLDEFSAANVFASGHRDT